MFRAEVFVTLKPTVNDPEGLTIRGGLHALGFSSVRDVRAGKYLVLTLDESDEAAARARIDEMARQLLANAVIEDFRIEISPESPSPSPARGEILPEPSPSPARGEISPEPSPSPARGGGSGRGLSDPVLSGEPRA